VSLIRELVRLSAGALADRASRALEDWSAELQAERRRLVRLTAWTSAAVGTGILAAAFAILLTALLVSGPARLAVVGAGAGTALAACIAIVLGLRREAARRPLKLPFLTALVAAGHLLHALAEEEPRQEKP
jgi:hypothetical protein